MRRTGISRFNQSQPRMVIRPPLNEEAEEGEELEQDQLDTLYKKAQSFDFDTPEAEPASTFVLTLRKYQKQALYWMMGKGKGPKSRTSINAPTMGTNIPGRQRTWMRKRSLK